MFPSDIRKTREAVEDLVKGLKLVLDAVKGMAADIKRLADELAPVQPAPDKTTSILIEHDPPK
jgi:hypothetical protein